MQIILVKRRGRTTASKTSREEGVVLGEIKKEKKMVINMH